MKKVLSLLATLALTLTVGFSQNGTQAAASPKQDGPAISFESETIDYGVVEQNSERLRIFKFTNTGNAPLIISNAKGSCGCTVPSWPKEAIAPGESGEIKVNYDTNRLGKFRKNITLTTNAGTEQVALTIMGEVIKKPEEPAGLPVNQGGIFNQN
jgi:hypothetical protein